MFRITSPTRLRRIENVRAWWRVFREVSGSKIDLDCREAMKKDPGWGVCSAVVREEDLSGEIFRFFSGNG